MDLAQWNRALMDGLIRKFGGPGDPLYLYVDGEVLADVSGMDDPQAAIDDFASAFRTTTFQREFLKARSWEKHDFDGDPLFLTALAMSVLAVTLDPLDGHTNNVYRRQRALLGYLDQDGGIPAGYDLVPAMWKAWNHWLESVGKRHGAPTAYAKSGLTYQGWARSQAFLRHQDKQDIYRFFRDSQDVLGDEPSAAELVSLLDSWLQTQGSRSRLARLAGDSSVSEELGVALKASFKYWEEEQEAAKRPLHVQACAMWDPDEDRIDLVAPLNGVPGVVGKTVRDFDGEEWELDSPAHYTPFSSITTNAGSWLSEPIDRWQFADNWWVSWNPPADGVFFFEPDALGLSWISNPVPTSSDRLRVLIADDQLMAAHERLGDSNVRGGTASSPGRLGSVADGYSWLTIDGESEFASSVVEELLPKRAVLASRNHRLVNGLKLRDRSYMVGFEPDVEFTFQPAGPKPEGVLNGETIDLLAVENTRSTEDALIGTRRLTNEFLDPGEHRLVVTVGEQTNASTLRMSARSAPALRPPREVKRSRNDVVHFSLRRTQEPTVLMVTTGSIIRALTLDESPRKWVAHLEEVSGAAEPERYFDSSWLDWARAVPGRRSEEILLGVQETPDAVWNVFRVLGDPKTLLSPSRVAGYLDAMPWDVAQLFGGGAEHRFADAEARDLFNRHQKKIRRDLTRIRLAPAALHATKSRRHCVPASGGPERVVEDNPLDAFLWWLTELGEDGALYSTAEAGFTWLWSQSFKESPSDFKETVRVLESLGHVRRENGRVKVQVPSLTWLPDSEAMAVIAGARTEDTRAILSRGEGSPDGRQDDVLGDTVPHVYTQLHVTGSGSEYPVAPTTVLMQLGAAQPPAQLAHTLGMEFYNPSFDELSGGVPSLSERLDDPALEILLGGAVTIDEYIASKHHLGGRWRQLSGGIPKLRGDAFLKIHRRGGKQYAWWSEENGSLSNCGWVVGQWAFHQDTDTGELFAIGPEEDQFAVADELPLPPDLEHFLVMRSGLLPQVARTKVRRLNAPVDKKWRIYTNVPSSIAALVCQKLGHRWSRSNRSWPTELKDAEVEFMQ